MRRWLTLTAGAGVAGFGLYGVWDGWELGPDTTVVEAKHPDGAIKTDGVDSIRVRSLGLIVGGIIRVKIFRVGEVIVGWSGEDLDDTACHGEGGVGS